MTPIRALILDMDGVLWHGDTALPGLSNLFETMDALALPYVLATNNAMKVAAQYTEKLASFGVSVAPEHILTSSEATSSYLRRHYPTAEAVYPVGEDGLHRALRAAGYRLVSPAEVRQGGTVPLVVGGLVRESLSYELMAMATRLVRGGATFVATNDDATYPTELGPLPGAGAVLSIIKTATGVQPVVVGKPGLAMFEAAVARLGTAAADTLMVGDRLTTDILGGKKAGLQTLLVLSGVSSKADITDETRPDFVLEDIRALATFLKARRTN